MCVSLCSWSISQQLQSFTTIHINRCLQNTNNTELVQIVRTRYLTRFGRNIFLMQFRFNYRVWRCIIFTIFENSPIAEIFFAIKYYFSPCQNALCWRRNVEEWPRPRPASLYQHLHPENMDLLLENTGLTLYYRTVGTREFTIYNLLILSINSCLNLI